MCVLELLSNSIVIVFETGVFCLKQSDVPDEKSNGSSVGSLNTTPLKIKRPAVVKTLGFAKRQCLSEDVAAASKPYFTEATANIMEETNTHTCASRSPALSKRSCSPDINATPRKAVTSLSRLSDHHHFQSSATPSKACILQVPPCTPLTTRRILDELPTPHGYGKLNFCMQQCK
jgi:hypothetical protein